MKHQIPTTAIEAISPNKARELLHTNTRNRRLRLSAVDSYASAMKRNEWELTHQGIAIDWNGELLDGQHRLAAVVKSGVTVPMMVTRNMPPPSFSVIDQGLKRTAEDVTRQPRPVIDPLSFLARLVFGTKFSPAQLHSLCALLLPTSQLTAEAAGKGMKGCASAQVRAACITRIAEHGDTDRALRRMQLLAHAATHEPDMPTSMHSFIRKFTLERQSTTNQSYDAFERSVVVFDPTRDHVTRIQIKEPGTTAARTRNMLRRKLQDMGVAA